MASETGLVTSMAIPSTPAAVELPLDIAEVVRASLRPGERVEHVVRPLPSPKELSPVMAFACGAPFLAFPAAALLGGSLIALIATAPFALAGGLMISSPILARRKAKRTAYVVTDQRVVAVESRSGELSVTSFEPAQLTHMMLRARNDGSGDLVVGKRRERFREVDEGLLNVADPRNVEQVIRGMIARLAAG